MVKCLNCGKETANPKFCSLSCSARFNNRAFPKKKKHVYFCKNCGAETRYRRSYCENCDPTKPQDFSQVTIAEIRSKARYQAHAWIRKLARRAYANSDNPQHCLVCGYSKHFEVCHIRPIQDFPEETTMAIVNSLENLVALCPNCHWEFDQGLLTL
jgi:5-methylcytosine-specific restriction endonuclease McrA